MRQRGDFHCLHEPFNELFYYGDGEGTGLWHGTLRNSTGIKPQPTNYPPLEVNPRLVELYERSLPHYEALLAHRLPIGE